MNILPATYFEIETENRAGQLAAINASLFEQNVPLKAIWGFGTVAGAARVVVIPEHPEAFKSAVGKLSWNVTEGGCFWITGQDKTGALVELLKNIASADLSILALDAVALDGKFSCYILAADEDFSQIAQLLGIKIALI